MKQKNHSKQTRLGGSFLREKMHASYAQANRFVAKHPFWAAVIFCLVYLIILQKAFLFSGDVWAETHMEYLDEAINEKYAKIFEAGWAGYLTILPSLLAKIYIFFDLPTGYIDFYYKAIIVVFTIGCVSFCASKFNQQLIKPFWLRLLLCAALLLLLYDISIFSFINIWYLGFVPLILTALNPGRLSPKQQAVYAVFGLLVVLSKPALLLFPFLLYRGVKSKEYFSNALVGTGVVYQTVIMLFFDPRNSGATATRDLLVIAQAVFTGGAAELFKLFRVVPTNFIYIIAANILLTALLFLVYKKYGALRSGLLAFGYAFSVYAYMLAPDAFLYQGLREFAHIYPFSFKYQREFLINVFFVLIFLFALLAAHSLLKGRVSKTQKKFVNAGGIFVLALLLFRFYTPIDVESAGVAANIEPFRHALNTGQSTCMPIPPTPRYFPHASWVYESNTPLCHARNFELSPDFDHMDISLKQPVTFTIPNDTPYELKTVYLIVRNKSPHRAASLSLIDRSSGMSFSAKIPARKSETINFISVNVAGMPFRTAYEFALSSPNPDLYWGTFKEKRKHSYYPYFAETRPPYIRE